jgi:hypothetical protein
MSTTAFSITKGMEVYSTDGQKIGTVGELLSGLPETQDSSGTEFSDIGSSPDGPVSDEARTSDSVAADLGRSEGGARAYEASVVGVYGSEGSSGLPGGPAGGIVASIEGTRAGTGATLTPSDTKYFEVRHGGILGIGGEHLYVPFSAVDAVAPGDSVTLICGLDECLSRFSRRPEPLPNE